MSTPYAAFEAFVADLAKSIAGGSFASSVKYGLRSHVSGASGVKHQVDVSFIDGTTNPPTLVLIECKCLNSPAKLAHAKALKATVDDVALASGHTCSVVGHLVSRKGVQRGAIAYANYYNLCVHRIAEQTAYDFVYRTWRVSGRNAQARGSAFVSAVGSVLHGRNDALARWRSLR